MLEFTQFYINGAWVDPSEPNSFDVINPATEDVCAHIALGNSTDVDRAVAAAKEAFQTYGWSSREERIDIMEAVIAAYQNHYAEVAQAISMEMGAPTKLATDAQAASGLGHLMTALEVLKNFKFEEDLGPHRVVKEPIGVCGMSNVESPCRVGVGIPLHRHRGDGHDGKGRDLRCRNVGQGDRRTQIRISGLGSGMTSGFDLNIVRGV